MIRRKRVSESQHRTYRLKEAMDTPFDAKLFAEMFYKVFYRSKGYHEAEKYMDSYALDKTRYWMSRRIEKVFVALEELDITVEQVSPWIESKFDKTEDEDYFEFASHYTATVTLNAPTKINKPQLFKTIGEVWSQNFGYSGEVSYQQIEFEGALRNKIWTAIKIELDNRNRLQFIVYLWRDERDNGYSG